MDYHKCIACRRGWVNPKKQRRIVWIRRLLCLRDIRNQRIGTEYGSEVHFGYGPQDKLTIIWKPSIHYCHDYIQKHNEPAEKDKNRYQYWAAVWHNSKPEIYSYEVPSDEWKHEPASTHWSDLWAYFHAMDLGTSRFLLEKDGDLGHGPGKSSIMQTWKEKNGPESYFNCRNSLDLATMYIYIELLVAYKTDSLQISTLGWCDQKKADLRGVDSCKAEIYQQPIL